MSKSSFVDIEFVPFPVLEDFVVSDLSAIVYVNPFSEDGKSEDGSYQPHYKIFEELPTLHDASKKKILAARLVADPEIFKFFVNDDPLAIESYLDFEKGIFKGRKISSSIPKNRIAILFSNYIQKRTEKLFEFLEHAIDAFFIRKHATLSIGESLASVEAIITSTLRVVLVLETRNLSSYDFSKISDQSIDGHMSLRRIVYLWTLVAFFTSIDVHKKVHRDPQAKALQSLVSTIECWRTKL